MFFSKSKEYIDLAGKITILSESLMNHMRHEESEMEERRQDSQETTHAINNLTSQISEMKTEIALHPSKIAQATNQLENNVIDKIDKKFATKIELNAATHSIRSNLKYLWTGIAGTVVVVAWVYVNIKI